MKISLLFLGLFWSILLYANPPRYFLVDPESLSHLTQPENKSYFSLLPRELRTPLLSRVNPVTEISCKNSGAQPQSSWLRLLGSLYTYLWRDAVPREVLDQLPESLKKDLQNTENQIIPTEIRLESHANVVFGKGAPLREEWNKLGIPSHEFDFICFLSMPESKSRTKILEFFGGSYSPKIALPCSLLTRLKNNDSLLLPIHGEQGRSILVLKASPTTVIQQFRDGTSLPGITLDFQDMLGVVFAYGKDYPNYTKYEKFSELGLVKEVNGKVKFIEPYDSLLSIDPTQKTTDWDEFLLKYWEEILTYPERFQPFRAEFALHSKLEVDPDKIEYFRFNLQARILLLQTLNHSEIGSVEFRRSVLQALKEAEESLRAKSQTPRGKTSHPGSDSPVQVK